MLSDTLTPTARKQQGLSDSRAQVLTMLPQGQFLCLSSTVDWKLLVGRKYILPLVESWPTLLQTADVLIFDLNHERMALP